MTSMRRTFVAVLACGLSASTVFATVTATFSPTSASVTAGTPISVDITINAGTILDSFNQANIVIGSDAGDAGLLFSFADAWDDPGVFDDGGMFNIDEPEYTPGIYAQSFEIISYANNIFFQSSIELGTLDIDTTSLAVGTYFVKIDKSTDGFSELIRVDENGETLDPISGSFSFEIVPEPATALMMLLCGVSLLRRARP